MVRLPFLLFAVLLCACGPSKQNPTDSGAAGQGGGQATGGTTGAAGATGGDADAAASPGDAGAEGATRNDAGPPGDAGVDASGLPPCPEIVAAKFGQVGSNCLRGCEVPEANDSGILGIIPVCRLMDADAKAFSLTEPAYCVLQDSTTFLCTGP